eukprot:COSAG01_NODE_1448_length_10275_cov_57.853872_6_plen_93_part_00
MESARTTSAVKMQLAIDPLTQAGLPKRMTVPAFCSDQPCLGVPDLPVWEALVFLLHPELMPFKYLRCTPASARGCGPSCTGTQRCNMHSATL